MGIVIDAITYVGDHPGLVISGFLLYVFIFALSLFFTRPAPGKNPFKHDTRKPPKPLELDQEARDNVIKQGFNAKRIPERLDAIVIGSGIGGLAAATTLAKAGKRVLVLEQHDQAGGCCHTFIEKGFEFDVGIHYIGEMRNNTLVRCMVEQLTDGQLVWQDLIDEFDVVALGEPGKQKLYPFCAGGPQAWKAAMLKQFPEEERALDQYLAMLKEYHSEFTGAIQLKFLSRWLGRFLINTDLLSQIECRREFTGAIQLKFMSRWLGRFLINTGLLSRFTRYFHYSQQSLDTVLRRLTHNETLRAVLSYSFGDYGTLPKDGSFAMHAALINHYLYGASYPRGGASEVAFHMIPIIERAGGRVLVRAPVKQVLLENGKAVGVRVERASGDVDVMAPVVISDAGLVNTLTSLLPRPVAEKSGMWRLLEGSKVKSGHAGMSIFVGLKGTAEELGLEAKNFWAFTGSDLDGLALDWLSLTPEQAEQSDLPLLFISFPSTKDPSYNTRFPGKSVCTIVTLVNWEWFEPWVDGRVKKRGEDYEQFKMALGRRAWQQTLELFPQLADKVEYFDVGSPLTNRYYLNTAKGEIYGLDHDVKRFSPEVVMNMRPVTDIPGLYLAGQDVLSCGFIGALMGGVLTASQLLHRNLIEDLMKLKTSIAKTK